MKLEIRDASTTTNAAIYLQCSPRNVQNLFWTGKIEGFWKGNGRGLMLYKDSLKAWKNRSIETLSE